MTSANRCYVVVDGYHGNDGYIDGTIRIFSTRQKAEEFIKKLQDEMKKGKRPGEQFSNYYNQTVMEIEMEWQTNQTVLIESLTISPCVGTVVSLNVAFALKSTWPFTFQTVTWSYSLRIWGKRDLRIFSNDECIWWNSTSKINRVCASILFLQS